jgi:IS1 family transposase
MSNMNRLDPARRAHVVRCLVEGMSLRGTARVTGVARMTVEKLLRDVGAACADYQDRTLRNLPCKRIQCDEIWSFCYAKRKNVTPEIAKAHPDAGDVWTWTAIDADSKLCVSFAVGDRSARTAWPFIEDIASRLTHRIQLTTDSHHAYLNAIEDTFGGQIDYAMLNKIYAQSSKADSTRYSPAECIGTTTKVIAGDPDPKHISTSYVERQNLTMRMHMRRFTRLTNAFSKKIEMHMAAVALHFMHYNFCQIHGTLRVTPAMAAGITTRPWEVGDLISLLPA